jgi:transcriptional regulator with XRE-family HTH domain
MAHPLKAYREAQSPPLSQAALAKQLGVDRVTVARWEIGKRRIDTSSLPEISAKTGIPAKELRPDIAELMGETQ